jgi:DNA primase
VLAEWGLPSVSLVGTHARREVREALARFDQVYLALDADDAGRAATAKLAHELGARALTVDLPGVKDIAELALRADGRDAFLAAVAASV